MSAENNHRRDQFARDGYYVCENVLEPDLVDRLNELSDQILDQQPPEHFAENRSTGSMVLIDWAMAYAHLAMAELIAHPGILAALAQLGFAEPKFGHGRIISKPPQSPPLFWHEDGRFWNDPVSYTTQPIQVFLMYYLSDTNSQNGCLRVVPGSHLKRHRLHDEISPRHTDKLRAYANPDDPGFSQVADEIDVPVRTGDLVIGYGSLLHSSHANQSDERRTVLTMWYYPDYPALPERTQATVASLEANNVHSDPTGSASDLAARLESLKIAYRGAAAPIETEWIPGETLK